MNRQTATIITIVVAVLTLCCSLGCCLWGAAVLAGGGTYTLGTETGEMPQWIGAPLICISVLLWLIPLGLWFFLVKKKEETTPI